MVEQYLGRETADDIFFSAMLSGLIPQKQASDMIQSFQKEAAVNWSAIKKAIGSIGSGIAGGLGYAWGAAKSIPPALGYTALGGAASGALGATVYDILKERVSQEDPETKFNSEIERLYAYKKREIEDAKWMSRVRAMRDELKRGYKKMTTDEYTTKYNALMDALNERSE